MSIRVNGGCLLSQQWCLLLHHKINRDDLFNQWSEPVAIKLGCSCVKSVAKQLNIDKNTSIKYQYETKSDQLSFETETGAEHGLNLMLSLFLIQVLAISFLISASACLTILLWFSKSTVKSTTRNDTSAVQAAHTAYWRTRNCAGPDGYIFYSLALGYCQHPFGTHVERYTSFCCWFGRGSGQTCESSQ